MVTTILVGAVLAGLGVAVIDVSVSNLQNSGRDRVAGIALDTSESGVAQAIEYIKTEGVTDLWCSPDCGTFNPWGDESDPMTVTLPNGRQYKTWIQVLQHFNPPTIKFGSYKIHSLGTAGTGPGSRRVEVTITAKPFEFPMGLYADTYENAGGGQVHTEHMFSRGCIINRNAINFTTSTDPQTQVTNSNDPWYGYPPAAHSTDVITDANQASNCTQERSIHWNVTTNSRKACADTPTQYRGDQDRIGAGITGSVCEPVTMGNTTSYFDEVALANSYGWRPRGLTNAQYDALKAKAQAQGNYWTNATLGSFKPPCATAATCALYGRDRAYENAVIYFKLTAGTFIREQLNDIRDYGREYCGLRSLVLVVEGGDMHVNNTVNLTAAIFVPDGMLKINGTSIIEGTVFAKYVNKFNGTADFYMDPCFVKNLPGGLFDVRPEHFREVDR